jgi:hypothetical protein
MLREACGVVTARFLQLLAPWPKRHQTRGMYRVSAPLTGARTSSPSSVQVRYCRIIRHSSLLAMCMDGTPPRR